MSISEIKDYEIRKNKQNQVLVGIEQLNTREFLESLTSVRFELQRDNLFVEYYREDDKVLEIKLVDLSRRSVSLIKKQFAILLIEVDEESPVHYVVQAKQTT